MMMLMLMMMMMMMVVVVVVNSDDAVSETAGEAVVDRVVLQCQSTTQFLSLLTQPTGYIVVYRVCQLK